MDRNAHPADLSVVTPCYNEAPTIEAIVKAILEQPEVAELIIVDDGSTDGTRDLLPALESDPRVRVVLQPQNSGKGAALRTGFALASALYVVVQDADLEYDPAEYPRLLAPLRAGKADVVYGSRFLAAGSHRVLYFWHSVANKLLTLTSNMLTDLNLSDMETCFKMFRRRVIQSIRIEEDRFGFEPEITGKVAAMRCRVYEVGISYHGRTYEEGKKIGFRDALEALVCVVRYAPFRLRRSTRRWQVKAPDSA